MMFTKKNTPPKLQRTLDGVRKEKNNTYSIKEKKEISLSSFFSFLSKKRKLTSTFLLTILILGGVSFFFSKNIKGATYGWIQSSWIGGVTVNTATHTNNQENWTEYASKDANIQADANGVTITGTSNSWVATTDGDWNAFSKTDAFVSSGAVTASKPGGGTCTTSQQCRSLACVAGICTDGCGVISDAEGNMYGSVIIGTQCWMAQNMRYLPAVSLPTVGSDQNIPYYYVYGYSGTDIASAKAYAISSQNIWSTEGVLYNWSAAMAGSTTPGAQGICPTGWHIPTDAEQDTLDQYLKDSGQTCNASRFNAYECFTAGTKLKLGGASGFHASLVGRRYTDGTFTDRGWTYFWSSSLSGSVGFGRNLSSGSSGVNRLLSSKANGFSVRCLKDS